MVWYMLPKKRCIDYIDIIVYNTNDMVIKGDKELTSNNAVSEICPSATTIAIKVDKETLLSKGVTLNLPPLMKCTSPPPPNPSPFINF